MWKKTIGHFELLCSNSVTSVCSNHNPVSNFTGVCVAQSYVFCIVFCRSLFIFVVCLSFGHCVVCRFSSSDYPFGIFKRFFA